MKYGLASAMRDAPEHGPSCLDAGRVERPSAQIVLVLQGGGALGAYQAGVYQALSESGLEPDWIVGTSIGAINGAIIAGNAPETRRARLQEFWSRVGNGRLFDNAWTPAGISWALTRTRTLSLGVPGFFEPNPLAALNLHLPVGVEQAAFYRTVPLRTSLNEIVDFEYINHRNVRFTVGAVNVRTGTMHYFDSRDTRVDVDHVMASSALPPGFPAIRIEGEPYWDGAIYSSTPIEVVFDDHPPRDSLIFSVDMWHSRGAEPRSVWDVLARQKDIQNASRSENHIGRLEQIHRLRHAIQDLVARIPREQQADTDIQELAKLGCRTTLHVVRLLAPLPAHNDHTKEIDFTHAGIRTRWQAGRSHAQRALADRPWRGDPAAHAVAAVH